MRTLTVAALTPDVPRPGVLVCDEAKVEPGYPTLSTCVTEAGVTCHAHAGSLSRSRGGAKAELLQAGAELFEAAAHARRQDPPAGAADREHAAVEVLAFGFERS